MTLLFTPILLKVFGVISKHVCEQREAHDDLTSIVLFGSVCGERHKSRYSMLFIHSTIKIYCCRIPGFPGIRNSGFPDPRTGSIANCLTKKKTIYLRLRSRVTIKYCGRKQLLTTSS